MPNEGRFYLPLTISLSVLFIVLSVRLTIAMLSTLLGPFEFGFDLIAHPTRYGIWLVDEVGAGENLGARLRAKAWRDLLQEMLTEDEEIIEARDLPELLALDPQVLVLPSARRLDMEGANALLRFVWNGGAVVLAESLGTLGPDGEWRGYQVMETLLGVSKVVPQSSAASRFIEVGSRGMVLSGPIGSLETLPLIAEAGVPGVVTYRPDLRWAPKDGAAEAGDGLAASMRLEMASGRMVWLGTGPASSAARGWRDARTNLAVFRSAVRWAGHRPSVGVRSWPREAEAMDDATVRSVDWERERELVQAAVEIEGRHRLLINVTNGSKVVASDMVLRVFLNRGVDSVSVSATTLMQRLPALRRYEAREFLDLELEPLAANKSYALSLETPGAYWY